MLDSNKLNDKLVSELREIAQNLGVADTDALRKQDLINKIVEQNNNQVLVETVAEDIVASEISATEGKPRKRLRTTKVKSETKQHREVPLEDTRIFEIPEEDETPPESPSQNIAKTDSTTEVPQKGKDLKPTEQAEPKKFERRRNQGNQNQNRNRNAYQPQ